MTTPRLAAPKSPPDAVLDAVFAAIADATRRALLEGLSGGATTVGELAARSPLTFAAVSKHLGVLERAGLVSRESDGRFRRCTLHTGRLVDATAWLSRYVGYWERQFETLVLHLEDARRKERKRWARTGQRSTRRSGRTRSG